MFSRIKTRATLAAKLLLHGDTAGPGYREIPKISQEEVQEAKSFFPMEKFFVFGHARSGTTMLTRLIRLHPEVYCNYQAHFFTRSPLLQSLAANEEVGEWLTRKSNRWNRGRDLSPVILRAAADFILERDARREGKIIVGDKSPNSLLNGKAVCLMHNIYPDARLIYIIRDGRDAAISHRFQAFIDFPDRLSPEDLKIRDAFRLDAQAFIHGKRSIFTEKTLRQAAEGWMRNVSETDRLGRQLYGESYQVLRYEDLLAQPEEEMIRLWAFLGATDAPHLQGALSRELQRNPDADWQKEKAQDIAQSLQKGKRGSWREILPDRDREIFSRIAGKTLSDWGYSG